MAEDLHYITGTMIKDYMFCPAIFYYKHILRIYEPETEMMVSGRRFFEKVEAKSRAWKTLLGMRRIKPDKVLYSAEVYSRRYGLAGVVDVVYWVRGRCRILELKESDLDRLETSHVYQAAIYALMAEETFKTTVSDIEVYYVLSKRFFRRRFTSGIRRYSLNILVKIRDILDGNNIPEPRFGRKCHSCWYKYRCTPG